MRNYKIIPTDECGEILNTPSKINARSKFMSDDEMLVVSITSMVICLIVATGCLITATAIGYNPTPLPFYL